MRKPLFTFIDLFAGIGGLRKGFEEQGGACVWTCEWDPYAVKTYRANFHDESEVWADINTATLDVKRNIPRHDVLLAGFPCQPFSLAGVSKKNSLGRPHGFLDRTQGTLFFNIAKILRVRKPRAFLLENVKNLVSHDKGQTYATILKTLDRLGYEVHATVIDAAHWLPQHRERIFLVGFRKEDRIPFDFGLLIRPGVRPVLSSILHGRDEPPEAPYTEATSSGTRVNGKYTLSPKLWDYLQRYAEKHRAKGNGFGCSVVGPDSVARTLSARYYKDGSEILVSQAEGGIPRRLTPRECARLMGFDDPNSETRVAIPVSDTRAYKQFGNSVAVPVVREVAKLMRPFITSRGAHRKAVAHRRESVST